MAMPTCGGVDGRKQENAAMDRRTEIRQRSADLARLRHRADEVQDHPGSEPACDVLDVGTWHHFDEIKPYDPALRGECP